MSPKPLSDEVFPPVYKTGYIASDTILLRYGISCGMSPLAIYADPIIDCLHLACDRSGAKNIGIYPQRIGGKWFSMIDVTDASVEDRELICKELNLVDPELITYDCFH
ncbi:hypothetical protein PILCRDRAFT_824900 [Piloderma croceum F 1598]|uniref:Uncharacterized protein n=1 Tax=Piloderma croceum (strain F 1598) TaxID=765440 RepID=A0A0C3AVA6_PILCF|nr:hypothetical protein PILCRDRAFT_824900 [Piloderma croceum F 1598]